LVYLTNERSTLIHLLTLIINKGNITKAAFILNDYNTSPNIT
jgi:hypothetical protein